ncbi:hypothetical protein AAHH78_40470, partial [Burkholderia pseudomallei]
SGLYILGSRELEAVGGSDLYGVGLAGCVWDGELDFGFRLIVWSYLVGGIGSMRFMVSAVGGVRMLFAFTRLK